MAWTRAPARTAFGERVRIARERVCVGPRAKERPRGFPQRFQDFEAGFRRPRWSAGLARPPRCALGGYRRKRGGFAAGTRRGGTKPSLSFFLFGADCASKLGSGLPKGFPGSCPSAPPSPFRCRTRGCPERDRRATPPFSDLFARPLRVSCVAEKGTREFERQEATRENLKGPPPQCGLFVVRFLFHDNAWCACTGSGREKNAP